MIEIKYEKSTGYDVNMNSGLAREFYSHIYISGKNLKELKQAVMNEYKTNWHDIKYGDHEIYIWHNTDDYTHLQLTLNEKKLVDICNDVLNKIIAITEQYTENVSYFRVLQDYYVDPALCREFVLTFDNSNIYNVLANVSKFGCITDDIRNRDQELHDKLTEIEEMISNKLVGKPIVMNNKKGKIKQMENQRHKYGFFEGKVRTTYYPIKLNGIYKLEIV